MDVEKLLKEKRNEILRVAKEHGAHNIRIFGSAAEGKATVESDIDFLVEMEQGRTLFDLGGLLDGLQNLLGRKVDVVTERSLNRFLRRPILKEARPL